MTLGRDTVTATILADNSISGDVVIGSSGVQSISIPAEWTAAPLTFQAALFGSSEWRELTIDGNKLTIPARPGQMPQINPALWLGIDRLRIRSGTIDSPVAQASDVTIGLNGTTALLAPSTSRRIVQMTETWRDSFPAFSALEDGPITFDLTRLLAPTNAPYAAEQIASVEAFSLTAISPDGVTDEDTAARIDGVASIQGPLITQRFGNWQADVPFIKYLVTAITTTTAGSTKVCKAYLPVRQ
jgi:hypothetical protein